MISSSVISTIVVGGGGFIGEAFLRTLALQATKRNICAIGRSKSPRNPLPEGVRYEQCDITNHPRLEQLLFGVDEVIDLSYSTVPKTSFDDPLFDVTANLPAAVSLQLLAAKSRVKKYLLVSSGGTVYGNTTAVSIDEEHPTKPISPYGISKLVTEKYGYFFQQMYGLPLVIARPGNPYGANQVGVTSQGFIGAVIGAILKSEPVTIYGNPGTVRDYIYIDDLARGLCHCLAEGEPGEIYNIGTGVGTDNLTLLHMVREVLGVGSDKLRIDFRPERVFDVVRNVLDASKLQRRSGWRPSVDLSVGIPLLWAMLQKT